MAVMVVMPRQGQSVESCIITELYKKKGDPVKKGEMLFSYETDKASFEEESPADGVISSFYNEGDEVPVLENMLVIGEPARISPAGCRLQDRDSEDAGQASFVLSPPRPGWRESRGYRLHRRSGPGTCNRKDVQAIVQDRPK